VLPILQNRVYQNKEEASGVAKGAMDLTYCNDCTFVFNADFDEDLMVYDEEYDNSVPSNLFAQYYDDIIHYLDAKYDFKSGGLVYDIGCGKGTFIKRLCELYPNVEGIGIDPSYEGALDFAGNLTFIREFFSEEHVTAKPKLVLSRHVLEHIEYPVAFLQLIQKAISAYEDVPFFIEIPDFEWICKHETIWDICYEHTNYFTDGSVAELAKQSQFRLASVKKAFGTQYLWVEGDLNPSGNSEEHADYPRLSQDEVGQFSDNISTMKASILKEINKVKQEGRKIVVWGMATKGVIYTNLIDPAGTVVDHCIDINENKQNRFTPITGHAIQPPEALKELQDQDPVVIVMNPNYADEIKKSARQYCQNAQFMDGYGEPL